MKLVYIANDRLPTEKAHGHQIVRMCEAFSSLGLEVVLLHPRRVQVNPLLKHQTIFDYYNVRTLFTVKTLPNFDVLRMERFVPQPFFAGLFSLHAFLWGGLAVRYAAKERGDFYFTRDPAVAWWLGRMKLPVILELHHKIPRRFSRRLILAVSNMSSVRRLIVTTAGLMEDFHQHLGISLSKLLVLPNGVNIERFDSSILKGEARKLLGLAQREKLLIYTGHLFLEKGVDTLIRAAIQLPHVQVILVGGMPRDVERVQRLAKAIRAANVTFIGHVTPDKVPLYLKAADVLVLPNSARYSFSIHPSPLKLFEYMASRRPIVTSNLPSICEVLKDKHTAIVVKPDSPESLANGIQTLLTCPELCERLSENAFRDVQQYTWRERAGKIVKLFEHNIGLELKVL